MTCQLRCAISWSGRVGEGRHEVSEAPELSLKGTARPHARSGDGPLFVRDWISVA
jgi:hypothetical protein